MRNWIKKKVTFWKALRVVCTKKAFQFVEQIENPKPRCLGNLKHYAEFYLYPHDFDLIACPPNLEVKFDRVCFSEIFFPEEFFKLQQGLNKLLSNYASVWGERDDEKRLTKWFSDIHNSASEGASVIYVGWLVFNRNKKKNKLNKLIHSAQVQLLYVNSAFIVLSFSAKPSDEVSKRFNSIVRSTPCPQNEILGFDFRYGITALNSNPSSYTRKAELEKFFLDINRGVVGLLRRVFDSGLSRFGPLPSVEVISINSSLEEIPTEKNLLKASKELRACFNFFSSLGYPSRSSQIYKANDWWKFYEVYRSELFYQTSHSYQVLMSTADYKKSESSVNSNNGEEMFDSISYEFHELLFIFALEHFYEVLKMLIASLRHDLEPVISAQSQGVIKLRTLRSGISKMTTLNGFGFQNSRIWTGIDEQSLWYYVGHRSKSLFRKKIDESDSGTLLDDMRERITRSKKNCDEQLILLRLAYEQVLSYKATALNFRLQQLTFWLSIAVGLLTIATLLPEDTRQSLLTLIWNWFNEHFLEKEN